MGNQDHVYVEMMVDSLQRKRKILLSLLKKTKEQETLLRAEELDYDRFHALLEEKGEQIEELNQIDEGFDALFKRVEKEILANRDGYQSELRTMQQLIKEVPEYLHRTPTLP